jgi:NRPS condensation-like uncharacterized protein
MLINTLGVPRDKNILTVNKKKISGNINAATSNVLELSQIKEVSKDNGITLNDIVMSSFSTALHEYLEVKGEDTTINLLMPANVRFKFYKDYEDIKLENKFSGVPIIMPVVSNMTEAYGKISKITKEIKKSFAYIYTSYALTFWTTMLAPR